MLSGKKILLSTVEEKNLEQLRQWRNEPTLRRYFREYREISRTMQNRWFRKINSDINQVNFEIHDGHTEKLIGHCGLYYIDWTSRTGEFGIYIGDRDYRSGGYGSDALRTLIKYGFEDLNLNRIWCEVYDNNTSIEVYKHLGFKMEGTLRQNYYNEGKFWDSHVLGMLKGEYERKKGER